MEGTPVCEKVIRGELKPGEQLIWCGRPGKGARPSIREALMWLFSVPGIVVVILIAGWPTVRRGVPIIPLVVLFFALVVPFCWLILYYLCHARRWARTYYGLTGRRVIVVSNLLRRGVKSRELSAIQYLRLFPGRHGEGTICFSPPRRWPGKGWYRDYVEARARASASGRSTIERFYRPWSMFFMIPGAETLYERIRASVSAE